MRFKWVVFVGFFIELLILLFIVIGLLCGGRIDIISSLLGYASLAWIIWLIFARFDHYGMTCMGNVISDSALFPNL